MSIIGLRRDHQQRAERLEARFPLSLTGPSLTPPAQITQDSNPPAAAVPAPAPTDSQLKDSHGKSNPAPAPAPVPAPVPVPDPVPAPVSAPAAPPVNSFFGAPTDTLLLPPLAPTSVVAPSVVVPTISSLSVVPPSIIPSSSSSSTTIVQTTPVVVPTPSSKSSVVTTPTTFRSLPQTTFIPSIASSVSPLASPSATSSHSSSGMSTGSIVGIAAGSLAAVAVVGILGVYFLKRYFNSRDDDDMGPSSSWMRNSVAIPDEAPLPDPHGPSATPRPPSMIERKQTQNYSNIGRGRYPQDQGGYPLDHGGYPQDNNMGMGYSGYQDSPYPPMPSFNPGQYVGPSSHQFFSPIASPPLVSPGAASFDESMPPMQHASTDAAVGGPVYFSRHDSNLSREQPNPSADLATGMPNPHEGAGTDGYATLNRGSVTPYQAQQYAAISRQLSSPVPSSIAEGAAPTSVHEQSPFEDPTPTSTSEDAYQELTIPSPAHARIDSSPPMIPPMRSLSPVGAVRAQSSIIQIASAFPAAPMSPTHPALPAAVAKPNSPKASSFKQPPPLSPAPGAQGQIVSVPPAMHVGQETPVQFGFNETAASDAASAGHETERRVSVVPNAKRMSVASKKSVAKSERPETLYDEEDAYGGF